jgi:hypothetical protein
MLAAAVSWRKEELGRVFPFSEDNKLRTRVVHGTKNRSLRHIYACFFYIVYADWSLEWQSEQS